MTVYASPNPVVCFDHSHPWGSLLPAPHRPPRRVAASVRRRSSVAPKSSACPTWGVRSRREAPGWAVLRATSPVPLSDRLIQRPPDRALKPFSRPVLRSAAPVHRGDLVRLRLPGCSSEFPRPPARLRGPSRGDLPSGVAPFRLPVVPPLRGFSPAGCARSPTRRCLSRPVPTIRLPVTAPTGRFHRKRPRSSRGDRSHRARPGSARAPGQRPLGTLAVRVCQLGLPPPRPLHPEG
jgi:hypothetical protein